MTLENWPIGALTKEQLLALKESKTYYKVRKGGTKGIRKILIVPPLSINRNTIENHHSTAPVCVMPSKDRHYASFIFENYFLALTFAVKLNHYDP